MTDGTDDKSVELAVNGGLMRGMRSEYAMLEAGATFVRETRTAPRYRLYNINDRHPAMLRVASSGASITLEVWRLPAAGFIEILRREPQGLSVGHVQLEDDSWMLGVIGEPILCEGMADITDHGGWRAYLESQPANDDAKAGRT